MTKFKRWGGCRINKRWAIHSDGTLTDWGKENILTIEANLDKIKPKGMEMMPRRPTEGKHED